MDCKKAQKILITDYVDGRLGNKQKIPIDEHLSYCKTCTGFLISVKKDVLAPLNNMSHRAPDELLWKQIKQAIEEKEQGEIEKSLRPDFWERLKAFVYFPKPVFVLATVFTMIFMIGTTGQLFMDNSQLMKLNAQDQVAYLSSVINDSVDITGTSNEAQTPIEKYFL